MTHIPCWIISLNPASDMATTLSTALTAQGVAHEFFPAVDGRQGMPALQGREHLDLPRTLRRHKRNLTSSEVGCYLAHYRAINKAFEQGLEHICILEDDVALEPDFARVLAELPGLPEDCEMVRLMGLRIRQRKLVSAIAGGTHNLVRPRRGWLGTQGYVLNRRGMQKFLDHAANIFEPIDKVLDHFWEFDLRIYGIEPHLIYELEHPSSIKKKPNMKGLVPLHVRLLSPILKLFFSIHRHTYLWRNRTAFHPAPMPERAMGRTKRIH